MTVYGGPNIITDGLVLHLDAANRKSFDPVNANTELLLHIDGSNNSTSFVDSSKNGFTVTAVGNAKISTDQSKFGGSSAVFDGTGDYLTLGGEAAFAFGTGDFTIEMWVYFNTISGDGFLYDSRGPNGLYPSIYRNGSVIRYFTNSANRIASGTVAANQWYHVAVVRSGGTTALFLNGSQQGTYADTNTYLNDALRPIIGAVGQSGFVGVSSLNGYIDELRIVKGRALYTSNFTPERKPYLDGNKIYDLSGETNNGTLVNRPAYSSANGGVLSFDGVNDFGETNQSNYLLLGTNNFTIETFVFFNTLNSNTTILRTDNGNAYNGVLFGHQQNLACYITSSGTSWDILSNKYFVPSGALTNTWYYLVMVRNGNTFNGYTNGSLVWTANVVGTPSIYQSNPIVRFGSANSSGAYAMNGRISNMRIYNKILNLQEIQQNYNALKGRFGL